MASREMSGLSFLLKHIFEHMSMKVTKSILPQCSINQTLSVLHHLLDLFREEDYYMSTTTQPAKAEIVIF